MTAVLVCRAVSLDRCEDVTDEAVCALSAYTAASPSTLELSHDSTSDALYSQSG